MPRPPLHAHTPCTPAVQGAVASLLTQTTPSFLPCMTQTTTFLPRILT